MLFRSRSNYGFAFAHSVRVDAEDNIWAIDEGTDTIVKFSPEGKVLMTIGRREDPVLSLNAMPGQGIYHGRNEKYRFGRETDVQLTRKFGARFTGTAKYADYRRDALTFPNVRKLWLQVDFVF